MSECAVCDGPEEGHGNAGWVRGKGMHAFTARLLPWSYCELIGAIGLEGCYAAHRQVSIANGLPMMPRKVWLESANMCLLRPPMMIRALQAGVEFLPMQLPTGFPPKKPDFRLVN